MEMWKYLSTTVSNIVNTSSQSSSSSALQASNDEASVNNLILPSFSDQEFNIDQYSESEDTRSNEGQMDGIDNQDHSSVAASLPSLDQYEEFQSSNSNSIEEPNPNAEPTVPVGTRTFFSSVAEVKQHFESINCGYTIIKNGGELNNKKREAKRALYGDDDYNKYLEDTDYSRIKICCSRYRKTATSTTTKGNQNCGCPWKANLWAAPQGGWNLTSSTLDHNHEALSERQSATLSRNRSIPEDIEAKVKLLCESHIDVSTSMLYPLLQKLYPKLSIDSTRYSQKDLENLIYRVRSAQRESGPGQAEQLVQDLHKCQKDDPLFFFKVKKDGKHTIQLTYIRSYTHILYTHIQYTHIQYKHIQYTHIQYTHIHIYSIYTMQYTYIQYTHIVNKNIQLY